MADDGGAEKRSGATAFQQRRGALVVVGGNGGVLEHEGEERKVRGMSTWSEGLQGWRSPERGGDGCDGNNLRRGGDAPATDRG
jgi:hypothetical protein